MTQYLEATSRDLILFVGSYLEDQAAAMPLLSKELGREIRPLVLTDEVHPPRPIELVKDPNAIVVPVDFDNDVRIAQAIAPYKDQLLAVICRLEHNQPLVKKVAPHVPYLHAPTSKSIDWTTDKIQMRRLLRAYDPAIAPKFLVVNDASKATFDSIEKKIGFPLILKPAGLAASLLVNVCYHREELEENLKNTVKRINTIYKRKQGRGEPQILVEEMMEGTMYSIDSYVNDRGVVYHCPPVHVKTGRAIGFDDFFGYQRITPVKLKPHRIERANDIAEKGIAALNLRSTSTHTELMKTEDGWKIVEIGPRIGGYRHKMYQMSFGINHALNDIRIHLPRKPVIHKKSKGYTAVLNFYAKQRGRLAAIHGINNVKKLESFKEMTINKKKGDHCDFARNGDDPVFDVILFNSSRSGLLADIHRIEKKVDIATVRPVKSAKS